MGCCSGFSRFIIVGINIVFALFGLAVLACGIALKVSWDKLKDAFKDTDLESATTTSHACIAFGVIMLVIAVMGCIGGWCEVKWMLGVYGVVMLIILIAEIIVVALVASKFGSIKDAVEEELIKSVHKYDEHLKDDNSKAWSAVFKSFECCGINSTTLNFNYDVKNWNMDSRDKDEDTKVSDGNAIPISCCRSFDVEDAKLDAKLFTDNKKCLVDQTKETSFTEPCKEKIEDWVKDKKAIIIGVGVAIFLLELLLIGIAFFLLCRTKDD